MTAPQLIALDWGSSRLRVFMMAAGSVTEERRSDSGASTLAAGPADFEAALRALIGDVIHAHPHVPLLACGMVGSAHGWVEAPYAHCPAGFAELPQRLANAEGANGLRVRIVPGVAQAAGSEPPEVMRGEETQVLGLLARVPELANDANVVLPGTHSKWVRVQDGRIVGFATRMTGELHALLCAHSVLGRLMTPAAAFNGEAFDRGVREGRREQGADLLRRLFSVRTLGLFREVPGDGLADYLSGLLIGSEIAAGLATAGSGEGRPLVLIGEATLCDRYRRALAAFDRAPAQVCGGAAADGLWAIAVAAGLID